MCWQCALGNLWEAPSSNLKCWTWTFSKEVTSLFMLTLLQYDTKLWLSIIFKAKMLQYQYMVESGGWTIETSFNNHLTQLNKQRKIFLFLSCNWTPPSKLFSDCCNRNSRTIGVWERSCLNRQRRNIRRECRQIIQSTQTNKKPTQ